jgi:hypothetical protein
VIDLVLFAFFLLLGIYLWAFGGATIDLFVKVFQGLIFLSGALVISSLLKMSGLSTLVACVLAFIVGFILGKYWKGGITAFFFILSFTLGLFIIKHFIIALILAVIVAVICYFSIYVITYAGTALLGAVILVFSFENTFGTTIPEKYIFYLAIIGFCIQLAVRKYLITKGLVQGLFFNTLRK